MATEASENPYAYDPSKYNANMGLKHGRINEIRCFFHVKPGHEEQLREDVVKFSAGEKRRSLATHLAVGAHAQTYTLFDNGTRLLFSTDFDTEWDPYIDDSVGVIGKEKYWMWWQHLEEFATYSLDNMPSMEEAKFLMNVSRETASVHIRAFPDLTVADRAEQAKLQEAFEKVLSSPEGAKALENPELAPLLELAADW